MGIERNGVETRSDRFLDLTETEFRAKILSTTFPEVWSGSGQASAAVLSVFDLIQEGSKPYQGHFSRSDQPGSANRLSSQ